MTFNICNSNSKFRIQLYGLWTYMMVLIYGIKYICSMINFEFSIIYIWFNIMRWFIKIFLETNNLFKSLFIMIETVTKILSVLRMKLTTNLKISINNIQYLEYTNIMSLFIKIISFKSN